MRVYLIGLIVGLLCSPAVAERVNDGYIGCLTESSLDEFITAAVNNDNRQMQTLLGTVCVPIGGREFSMVDQGFVVSEIRVYVGSDSVLLFTPSEATR